MKILYSNRCSSDELIPLFQQDWWLDVVAGDKNWDVIVINKSKEYFASFVYFITKKEDKKIITMPKLTQNMGLYLSYPKNQKYEARLRYEKKIIKELLSKLPDCYVFRQNFHYSITNWLPFMWEGYQQTTRYTYVIEDTKDLEQIWRNFNHKTRNDIRKASKVIEVVESDDLEIFYELNTKTFIRQGKENPSTFEDIESLYKECKERGCAKLLLAKDNNGVVHSGGYFVWDKMSVYYLLGGINPAYTDSASMSLVIWKGIQTAAKFSKKFDFEGSVIESIETFFRGFGAIQKPYFQIRK